jgi:hypothetical protein
MGDYKKAKELIRDSDEGSFVGSIEESIIAEAENALGLKFPPTYRQFLADFGCGDIYGNEIYGIIDSNFQKSAIPNGIWLTLNERQKAKLPKSLILIAQGYDGYLALDAMQENKEEDFAIIEWVGGNENNKNEAIYADFGAYFLKIVMQK